MIAQFRSSFRVYITALLLSGFAVICGWPKSSYADDRLLVFAAASTYAPMQEITRLFARQENVKVDVSYAGSSTLARQIEAGAPVDIFLSANVLWIEYLISKGLLAKENTASILSNSLVLIAPKNHTGTADTMNVLMLPDILGADRLAIGDPDHVPAGIYAKQALEHFGLWQALRTRLAPQTNVKNVAYLVARQESPFGIVYKTDAMRDAKLKIVTEFPETSHDKIRYMLGELNSGNSVSVAKFRNFLLSQEAMQIFRGYGFRPLENGMN